MFTRHTSPGASTLHRPRPKFSVFPGTPAISRSSWGGQRRPLSQPLTSGGEFESCPDMKRHQATSLTFSWLYPWGLALSLGTLGAQGCPRVRRHLEALALRGVRLQNIGSATDTIYPPCSPGQGDKYRPPGQGTHLENEENSYFCM